MAYTMQVQATKVRSPATIGAAYNVVGGRPYEGAYEFTPTTAAQTIPTEQRFLSENIIINPIPSNYGLITWDGHTMTVS